MNFASNTIGLWKQYKHFILLVFLLTIACREQEDKHSLATSVPAPLSTDLMLTDAQIKLANISTERVALKPLGHSSVLAGKIQTDPTKTIEVTTRIPGRIEKLFLKETGVNVKQGQALYKIFSESLQTLQREYLVAKEQAEKLSASGKRYQSLVDASRQKLILLGMTARQIDQLNSSNTTEGVTIYSATSGTITTLSVAEGQYVNAGDAICKLENFNNLWIEADLYPGEASSVEIGTPIMVHIDNMPMINAAVTSINPEYRSGTVVTTMRALLKNNNISLPIGQSVQIEIKQGKKVGISLPTDAIIRTEDAAHAFIQSGKNTFRPVRVTTGIENYGDIEVTHGLKPGDTVVVSGAYLLLSEIILKTGSSALSEHHH